MHLNDENLTELARKTRNNLIKSFWLYTNHVVVYHKQYFAFLSLIEYTNIVINLKEPARKKLKKTMYRLEREFVHGLEKPRLI